MNTVLYIVRHGTTDNNLAFKYQGWLDTELNDLGKQQGSLLTDYFKDIELDVAYSSPLIRARQTLDFVLKSQKKEIPVFLNPDFRELDLGIFDDHTVSEVSILFPELQDSYNHHPGTLAVPGGETTAQAQERFVRGIYRMIRKHPGKTLVLTSHGFAIQTWLNYASGIPLENMREWCLDNVAVSRFTFDDSENCTIDFIGDSHHLKDELKINYDWEKLTQAAPLLIFDGKCKKCRQARAFLEDSHLPFQMRDLRKDPLRPQELQAVTGKTCKDFKKMLNTRGSAWKQLNAEKRLMADSQNQMAEMILSDPSLLRHPVLVTKEQVFFGFDENEWQAFYHER